MEATQSLRKLKMLVGPKQPGAANMDELEAKAEAFGAEQGELVREYKATAIEVRLAIRVHAALADAYWDLDTEQFERLMRVGFAKAGVLRK